MSKSTTFFPKRTFNVKYNNPDTQASTSAISGILSKALTGEANDLMKAMVDHKTSLGVVNDFGRTVLHILIDNDKLSPNDLYNVAKHAVELGAPVDLSDGDGIRPLHLAAQKQNRKLVEYLIEKGAEPLAATNTNLTPLHYAIIPQTVNCKPRSESLQKTDISEPPKKQIKKNTDELYKYVYDKLQDNQNPFIMYVEHLGRLAFDMNLIPKEDSDVEKATGILKDVVATSTASTPEELRQYMRTQVKSFRDQVYQRALTEFTNGFNEAEFKDGTEPDKSWGPNDAGSVGPVPPARPAVPTRDEHKVIYNFTNARDWYTERLLAVNKKVDTAISNAEARINTIEKTVKQFEKSMDNIKRVFTILWFMNFFEMNDTGLRDPNDGNPFPPPGAAGGVQMLGALLNSKRVALYGPILQTPLEIKMDQFSQDIYLDHILPLHPSAAGVLTQHTYPFGIFDNNLVDLGDIDRLGTPFDPHNNVSDYLDYVINIPGGGNYRSISDGIRYNINEMDDMIDDIKGILTTIKTSYNNPATHIDAVINNLAQVQAEMVNMSFGLFITSIYAEELKEKLDNFVSNSEDDDEMESMMDRFSEIMNIKDIKRQRTFSPIESGDPINGYFQVPNLELYQRVAQGMDYYVVRSTIDDSLYLAHMESIRTPGGPGAEEYYDRLRGTNIQILGNNIPQITDPSNPGQDYALNIIGDTPQPVDNFRNTLTKNAEKLGEHLLNMYKENVGMQEDLGKIIKAYNQSQGMRAMGYFHNTLSDTSYEQNQTDAPANVNYLRSPLPPNKAVPKDMKQLISIIRKKVNDTSRIQPNELFGVMRELMKFFYNFKDGDDVTIIGHPAGGAPVAFTPGILPNNLAPVPQLYLAGQDRAGAPIPAIDQAVIGTDAAAVQRKTITSYPILKSVAGDHMELIKYLMIMYTLQTHFMEKADDNPPADQNPYTKYVELLEGVDPQRGEAIALSTIGKMADKIVISTFKNLISSATNLYVQKTVYPRDPIDDDEMSIVTKIFDTDLLTRLLLQVLRQRRFPLEGVEPQYNLYAQSLIVRPDEELFEKSQDILTDIYSRYDVDKVTDLRFMSRPLRNYQEDVGEQIRRLINPDSVKDTGDICYAIDESVAQTLIARGADINAKDTASKSPLSFAVDLQNVELIRNLVAAGAAVDVSMFEYSYDRLLNLIRSAPMFNLDEIEHRIAKHMVDKFGINVIPDKSIAILRMSMYLFDHQLTLITNRYPNMYKIDSHSKILDLIGFPPYDSSRLPISNVARSDPDTVRENMDGYAAISDAVEKLSRQIIEYSDILAALQNQLQNLQVEYGKLPDSPRRISIGQTIVDVLNSIADITAKITALSAERTQNQQKLERDDPRIDQVYQNIDQYQINNRGLLNRKFGVAQIYDLFFNDLNGIHAGDETTFEYITYFQLWSSYLTDLKAKEDAEKFVDYTQMVKAVQSYLLKHGDVVKTDISKFRDYYYPFHDLYSKVYNKYGEDYFNMSIYLDDSFENYALKQLFDIMEHVFKHTMSIDLINVTAGLIARSISSSADYRVAISSTFDILVSSGFIKECLRNLPKKVIKSVCKISEGEDDKDAGAKVSDILNSTLGLLASASFSGLSEETMKKLKSDINSYYSEYMEVYTAEMHDAMVRQLKSLMAQSTQLEILQILSSV